MAYLCAVVASRRGSMSGRRRSRAKVVAPQVDPGAQAPATLGEEAFGTPAAAARGRGAGAASATGLAIVELEGPREIETPARIGGRSAMRATATGLAVARDFATVRTKAV